VEPWMEEGSLSVLRKQWDDARVVKSMCVSVLALVALW